MESNDNNNGNNGDNGQLSTSMNIPLVKEDGKSTGAQRRKTHRASTTTRLLGQLMYDKSKKSPEGLYSGGNGSWVLGVLFIERNPSVEVFHKLINDRLLKMARFRSQLVVGRVNSYFREVDNVDLNYHAPQVFLPGSEAPWNRDKLFDYIGKLNAFEYDLTKPLWRMILIPEMDDGRAAVVACINHAIGDGLSQVEVLFSLLDIPEEKKEAMKHSGKRASGPSLPWYRKAGIFFYGVYHGITVPFSSPDPPNSLKLKDSTKPSPIKLLAATDPIPLEKMKEVKNKFPGATLNDVMMTVMTLTLKAFFKEEGSLTKDKKVSGQFPISIRGKGEGGFKNGEPHNKFSYGFFDFDFKCEDRTELVWRVKRQIDKIKLSPSPFVADRLAKVLIKIMPRRMFLDTVINASNIGTAQLSNVPGPQAQVTMAGLKVEDMTFFLFSPLGMYFGILSYNGTVSAAINLDASMGVDPKLVAKHWKSEFDALYNEAMAHDGPINPPKYGCCD